MLFKSIQVIPHLETHPHIAGNIMYYMLISRTTVLSITVYKYDIAVITPPVWFDLICFTRTTILKDKPWFPGSCLVVSGFNHPPIIYPFCRY